jgi:DNA-binding IclR family transcriptional regulator
MNIRDNPDLESFIQRYAKLSASWGMPLTAARVLAYLLLSSRPVSLDEIAEDMQMSKASAWGAAKHLEAVHQIERSGEPGTKRALFAPVQDYTRSLYNYSQLLRRSSDLMREAAGAVVSPVAVRRLRGRSKMYLAVHKAIENTVEEIKVSRRLATSE